MAILLEGVDRQYGDLICVEASHAAEDLGDALSFLQEHTTLFVGVGVFCFEGEIRTREEDGLFWLKLVKVFFNGHTVVVACAVFDTDIWHDFVGLAVEEDPGVMGDGTGGEIAERHEIDLCKRWMVVRCDEDGAELSVLGIVGEFCFALFGLFSYGDEVRHMIILSRGRSGLAEELWRDIGFLKGLQRIFRREEVPSLVVDGISSRF